MSYILEALKKAQAERQLGNAPDIHTPAAVPVPAAASAANRKPLLIGLGAGVLVAGIAAGLVWRAKTQAGEPAVLAQNGTTPVQTAPAAPAVSVAPPVAAPVTAPSAPVPVAPDPAAPAPAVQAAPVQAPPVQAAPVPPPVLKPAPVPQPPPAPRKAAPAPAADPGPASQAVYLPAPTRAPEPAPAPVRAPDPVAEENLRTLQQLPEAIQREVPRVTVGGYIYSPNPADRLLLVDKTLRREGEELAPGLVLERLMPKYAVMNFRGTRYRVGY